MAIFAKAESIPSIDAPAQSLLFLEISVTPARRQQNDRMVIGNNDFYPLTHYLPLARKWTNPLCIIGNVLSFITLSLQPRDQNLGDTRSLLAAPC
jgi:hypothetical protein